MLIFGSNSVLKLLAAVGRMLMNFMFQLDDDLKQISKSAKKFLLKRLNVINLHRESTSLL